LRELHLPTFRECFEELARRAVLSVGTENQPVMGA
jgi:hypothetical protein